MKVCRTCRQAKPISDFYRDSHYADKHKCDCKACYTVANVTRMRKNAAQTKAQKKAWESANRDRARAHQKKWRDENKDAHYENYKRWAEANRDKRNALHGKRRAALLNAIPAWANAELIAEVYALAASMSVAIGIKYHVDHIVPLQGKTVCGLHVHNNLQILPASENIKKHNKMWPDMPEQRMFA